MESEYAASVDWDILRDYMEDYVRLNELNIYSETRLKTAKTSVFCLLQWHKG